MRKNVRSQNQLRWLPLLSFKFSANYRSSFHISFRSGFNINTCFGSSANDVHIYIYNEPLQNSQRAIHNGQATAKLPDTPWQVVYSLGVIYAKHKKFSTGLPPNSVRFLHWGWCWGSHVTSCAATRLPSTYLALPFFFLSFRKERDIYTTSVYIEYSSLSIFLRLLCLCPSPHNILLS